MFKNVIKEQLKVPAHIDYLSELRDFVTRVGKKHGVSDKIINAFKLAIDEAGTNIIRHAYREFSEPGFILLRVIVRKASITISLIDQGKYFDPKEVKNPDLKRYVEIGKKGGLGIFIIRKLMDDIDYRRTEEGNELRLTKYRDEDRSDGVKALPQKVKTIPLSLKAKYFIRTALIITFVVAGAYGYFYYKVSVTTQKKYFAQLTRVGNQAFSELMTDERNFQIENLHHLFATVFDLYKKYNKDVYEFLVVDRKGMVTVTSDTTSILSENERIIGQKIEVKQNIFQYAFFKEGGKLSKTPVAVYDYVLPIVLSGNKTPWGDLHVRMLQAKVQQEILRQRWEYARFALSILLFSYAGAILLIYLLLNPFRKLADWIRALDHGEVQDEMDIDSSTEIGEIAKAFSEITTKFRESQKHLAEQEQLQKEMQVAQEIQQTLLPTEFPEIEGYEIASYYEAAKEVGGDYFDFVEVDKDTMGIVVADVSGKGVPGSLVMTMIRTALRTEARGVKDAAEVLARVNDFVVDDMKKGMFVTIFYVIIDSKRRRLNYASAGHNPMILYRPITRKTYYLNPKGFPIGIQLAEKDLFRRSIESDTIQLAEDDILLLYTDGITEAMNSRRELFGEERMLKVIREYGHLRVKPFIEKVHQEINSFTEGNVQYDDITLVAIKEKTTYEKEELRRAKLAHKMITEGKSIREACELSGITTYAYYNKYKRQFEQDGVENYEIDETISVEAKHISIEDKTKIFDIIRNHPEFGAKRISEELNTEKYSYTQISESKIYDELVRSRLNTRQLREAFVARGGRTRRQLKPPGTPMLTLDGRIIMDQKILDDVAPKRPGPFPREADGEKPSPEKPPVEIRHRKDSTVENAQIDMEVLSTPIEDLLDKTRQEEQKTPVEKEAGAAQDKAASPDKVESQPVDENPTQMRETSPEEDTVSFQQLFDTGSIFEELSAQQASEQPEDEQPPEGTDELYASPAANIRQTHRPEPEKDRADQTARTRKDIQNAPAEATEEELPFDDVDELLKNEIISSFAENASNVVFEESNGIDIEKPAAAAPEEFEANADVGKLETETEAASDEPAQELLGESDPLSESDEEKEKNQGSDSQLFVEIFSGKKSPPPTEANETEGQSTEQVPLSGNHAKPPENTTLNDSKKFEPETKSGMTTQQYKKLQSEKEQLLVLGLRFYKKREFDKAIKMFHRAIERFPEFKEAHSILGNAFFRTGNYDEAYKAYLKVLELDPKDATALENIGVIYANKGNLEKAIAQWRKILILDPKRVDIERKIAKASALLSEKEVTEQ